MQTHGGRVKQLFGVGLEIGLGAFLIAMLFFALKSPSARAGSPSEESGTPMTNALALPQAVTLCLQDDSSGAFLMFDSTTGTYTFNSCTGVTLSGTGMIRMKGSVVTLQDFKPDRKLVATDDLALKRGNAGIQILNPPPVREFTIYDRNTANDTCTCPMAPGGR